MSSASWCFNSGLARSATCRRGSAPAQLELAFPDDGGRDRDGGGGGGGADAPQGAVG